MLWTAPSRHESAIELGAVRTSHDSEEPGHAKDYDRRSRYREVSVQVHGVDADGNVVFCCQLKRRYVLTFFQKPPSCPVGIEACASSHYWSRELQALGHALRLVPPASVKPYVKRHHNDLRSRRTAALAVLAGGARKPIG